MTLLIILILSSQVFIGLGFPYEGPAPIEAITQGCVFLNPKVVLNKTIASQLCFLYPLQDGGLSQLRKYSYTYLIRLFITSCGYLCQCLRGKGWSQGYFCFIEKDGAKTRMYNNKTLVVGSKLSGWCSGSTC